MSNIPFATVDHSTLATSSPDFLLFDMENASTLTHNVWKSVPITYALTGQQTSNNSKNITVDANGVITFENTGVYLLNANFRGYWGQATVANVGLFADDGTLTSQQATTAPRDLTASASFNGNIILGTTIPFSGGFINITTPGTQKRFWAFYFGANATGSMGVQNDRSYVFGSITKLL